MTYCCWSGDVAVVAIRALSSKSVLISLFGSHKGFTDRSRQQVVRRSRRHRCHRYLFEVSIRPLPSNLDEKRSYHSLLQVEEFLQLVQQHLSSYHTSLEKYLSKAPGIPKGFAYRIHPVVLGSCIDMSIIARGYNGYHGIV